MIQAPFTPTQVESLNEYQNSGVCHPFTCDNNSNHILVATEGGWICPECDYTQNWAHAFMGDWSWKRNKVDIMSNAVELREKLQKLDEENTRISRKMDKLHHIKSNIEAQISDTMRMIIIEEKLLSPYTWDLKRTGKSVYLQLIPPPDADAFFLDYILRETSYHWRVCLDNSDNPYGDHEAVLHGSDGDYIIELENTPGNIYKWVTRLGIQVSTQNIDERIRDCEDEIANLIHTRECITCTKTNDDNKEDLQ